MKSSVFKALTISAIVLASQSAFASDGTINFTGELTAQTCSINGATADGLRDLNVALPAASQSNLSSVGSTSSETPFQIALTSCAPATGTVRTRFESGPNVDLSTGELLTNGVGSSPSLRIQLLNESRSVIAIGANDAGQNSEPQNIAANGSATLNYIARYHRISATPLAVGALTSSVTYSMYYN